MKPYSQEKSSTKRNGYQSDDENIRYKLNHQYFNNASKSPKPFIKKQQNDMHEDDNNIRYKFPTVLSKPANDRKPKPKPKIKVNFWSSKQTQNRLHEAAVNKDRGNRRHTIAVKETSPKSKHSVVKVRKRVSFLPSPLFSDNHVPMVTVPDDLTIHLNEEEANDLGADLNIAFANSDFDSNKNKRGSSAELNPRNKRKRAIEDSAPRLHGGGNELEFFSKYVEQKLRKMETNQRIYSENLINTVLMLGQLGKLSGKSKIGEA